MARSKNLFKGEQITVMLPPGSIDFLEELSLIHGYGKNASETAGEIIRAEIRRIVISGDFDRLLARLPKRQRISSDDAPESEGS
jgi:hypothetical protein